jgi:hypothetical protein
MRAMVTTQIIYCEIISTDCTVQQFYRYYHFLYDIVFQYIYVNEVPYPSNLNTFNAES